MLNPVEPVVDATELPFHPIKAAIDLVELPVDLLEPSIHFFKAPIDGIETFVDTVAEFVESDVGPALSHHGQDRRLASGMRRVVRKD